MKMIVRRFLAPLAFFISILLSAQALAFDVGGLSYTIIGATNNVEVMGRQSGNTDLDIVIPDTVVDGTTNYSVTSIVKFAFFDNALTSVTIGNSVATIGERAFAENDLISVTIGDSVRTIGEEAFGRNEVLTSVTIGNSVTTIGVGAFQASDLTTVIIPDSVTSIGERAFGDNTLASVAFEGNFGSFSPDMFDQNPDLAKITYCEGKAGWPQAFDNGSTTITTTSIACAAVVSTPVPTSPLWLLGIMVGLLSLVAVRKLRKV